jgi:microcystin-dependent protein
MSEPFIAEIRIFAGNFAPRGWAFCDGQLLPISQNTALFSLIGTTYGGDGRSTIALPNLQGRAPMHPGRGPGLTTRRLGEKVGVEVVTLTEAQIPSHNHQLHGVAGRPDPNPVGNVPGPTKSLSRSMGGSAFDTTLTQVADMSSAALSTTGGGQAHENRQPFLAVNYIIALQGLYPSRG